MLAVQGFHGSYELLAVLEECRRGLFEVVTLGYVNGIQRLLHLREEVLLGHLVAVQLQAERLQSHLGEALLHHAQRRHLLGHEEHALALVEGVGYHVGDGLTLARAGRAVQDEALALTAHHHGIHLTGIHIHRYGIGLRLHLLVLAACVGRLRLVLPLQLLRHQGGYHRVVFQLVGPRVYVVPHHELAEREESQEGFLQHAPPLLLSDGQPHALHDALHIHAMVVEGQRVQRPQIDAKLLTEHLHQRGVEYDVFIAAADHIARGPTLAHQIYWQQQDGRIAWLRALVVLKPAQHAQRHEEAVGTVLLHGGAGGAVDILQGILQLRFAEVRHQLVVQLLVHHLHTQVGRLEQTVVHAVFGLQALCEAWQGLIAVTVLQQVFQLVDVEGDEWYHALAQLGIQQVVAQREVQQLALPDGLLGDRLGGLVEVERKVIEGLQRDGVLLLPHQRAAYAHAHGEGGLLLGVEVHQVVQAGSQLHVGLGACAHGQCVYGALRGLHVLALYAHLYLLPVAGIIVLQREAV